MKLFAICALLACSAPPAVAAAPELQPFNATYNISWKGISAGSAQVELTNLGDGRWSYKSRREMGMLFAVAKSGDPTRLESLSTFAIQDSRIVPRQFTADGERSDKEDQELNFDWTNGRVTGSSNGKPFELPLQPGTLDPTSVQVAVMQELLAQRTPQHFSLLDKGRVKDYVYTFERDESLKTAVGTYRTVIFRSSQAGSSKSTLFWCAPELGFLPLKVEAHDGKSVQWSMTVNSLAIADTPVTAPITR